MAVWNEAEDLILDVRGWQTITKWQRIWGQTAEPCSFYAETEAEYAKALDSVLRAPYELASVFGYPRSLAVDVAEKLLEFPVQAGENVVW